MEMAKCRAKGCPDAAVVKGFCRYHYNVQWKLGKKSNCSRSGCREKAYIKGLCSRHYAEHYTEGLRKKGVVCSICGENPFRRSLCAKCYERERRKRLGLCTVIHCPARASTGGLCARHAKKMAEKQKEKKS